MILNAKKLNFSHSIYLSYHEKEQSRYNYIFDWNIGIEKRKMKENYATFNQLSVIEFQNLNTKNNPCKTNNDIKLTDCVNQVYEKELGCKLPWLYNKDITHGICKSQEKFKQFWNMTIHAGKKSMEEKLENHGCLISNCKISKWQQISSNEISGDFESDIQFRYFLPARSRVTFYQDIRIYDENDFIADFGGYIGLMLGLSILTIYDYLVSFIKSITNFMHD